MKPIDFTLPRRLDKGGVILQGLRSFWQFLKTLGLAFIYFGIQYPRIFLTWQFWLALLGLFLLQMLWGYFRYRQFYYYADEENAEFIIEEGVLNKTKTVIKFENVLQINIKQDIIQQALDLYGIEIESAGSKDKEADLFALDEETAEALRQYLSAKELSKAQQGPTGSTKKDTTYFETVFVIPNRHILAVSLFSNYTQGLGLFLAFVVSTFEQTIGFNNFPDPETWSGFATDFKDNWLNMTLQIVLMGMLILLVPILINLYRYFITYYNFSLRKSTNENLLMHFGLFQVKDIILHRHRVQTIHTMENPILRMLGLRVLSLHQIMVDVTKPETTTIRMPGISNASRAKLWTLLFDHPVYKDLTQLRPRIGLLVNRLMKAALILGPMLWYLHWTSVDGWILRAVWTLFILAALLQFVYYFNYKFLVGEEFLIKRSGIWDVDEQILPIDRLLSVEVSQSLLQKRFGTANLVVSTSSGILTFKYFSAGDLRQLSDRLIYQIEK